MKKILIILLIPFLIINPLTAQRGGRGGGVGRRGGERSFAPTHTMESRPAMARPERPAISSAAMRTEGPTHIGQAEGFHAPKLSAEPSIHAPIAAARPTSGIIAPEGAQHNLTRSEPIRSETMRSDTVRATQGSPGTIGSGQRTAQANIGARQPTRDVHARSEVANIGQYSTQARQRNPALAHEFNQTRRNWDRNPEIRNQWHRDWQHYAGYHHYRNFNFDTFANFAFFAPWFLFPAAFYPNFFTNYPISWVNAGWFSYPSYWDTGYAQEATLVEYVQKEDFDAAIDRLETRLSILGNQADNEAAETDLPAKINEIVWLLNDLKKIITEKAPLPNPEIARLTTRIDTITARANQILGDLPQD